MMIAIDPEDVPGVLAAGSFWLIAIQPGDGSPPYMEWDFTAPGNLDCWLHGAVADGGRALYAIRVTLKPENSPARKDRGS